MYKINQSTNSALEVRRQLFCIPRINFHVLIISTDCYMLTAAKTTSFVVIFDVVGVLYCVYVFVAKIQKTDNGKSIFSRVAISNREYVVHTYCHNF